MCYIINTPCNWVHLDDASCYNHNYYRNPNTGETILEDCQEEYGICDYYLVDENLNIIKAIGSLYWDDMNWRSESDIKLQEYFS